MNKNILLVGGGGHCKSVLDSLLSSNEYDKIGIIDIKENIGKTILGTPIIGSDDDLLNLFNNGYKYAFVTMGSIGNPKPRIKLFDMLNDLGFGIPNIIDGSAVVSNFSNFKKGIFIAKNSIVNAGVTISDGAIINSGSILEHDCNIGEFVHIAPGSVLGGEVNIDRNSHIGSNSSIKQQVHIGFDSIIGIGSVVTKDIGNNVIAYGNPCTEVKSI